MYLFIYVNLLFKMVFPRITALVLIVFFIQVFSLEKL